MFDLLALLSLVWLLGVGDVQQELLGSDGIRLVDRSSGGRDANRGDDA